MTTARIGKPDGTDRGARTDIDENVPAGISTGSKSAARANVRSDARGRLGDGRRGRDTSDSGRLMGVTNRLGDSGESAVGVTHF